MRRWVTRYGQGMAAAVAAVGFGLGYMALAGAPPRLMVMNLAALLIGIAALAVARRSAPAAEPGRGLLLLALAIALAAATAAGTSVEGAARWLQLGAVTVQPSLILVPVLLAAYARQPDGWGAAAIGIAVLTIAAQPDRSLATMLFAGSAALAAAHRSSTSVIVTALAGAGLAATMLQADTLPAAAYVDQILYTSWDAHPLAGVAVWAGTALLFVPAIAAWRAGRRTAGAVFAAMWAAAVLSAALGNYPTPLVGYGGSAIIGYVLSLLSLEEARSAASGRPSSAVRRSDFDPQELQFAGVAGHDRASATRC